MKFLVLACICGSVVVHAQSTELEQVDPDVLSNEEGTPNLESGIDFIPVEEFFKLESKLHSFTGPSGGTRDEKRVVLDRRFPPPEDQGSTQLCVGFALAQGLKSFQEGYTHNWENWDKASVFSQSFLYNSVINNYPPAHRPDDCGPIRIIDALDFLQREGAAHKSEFQDYLPPPCPRPQISAKQRAELGKFRVGFFSPAPCEHKLAVFGFPEWHKDGWVHLLSEGYPIVIGAEVRKDLSTARCDSNGVLRDVRGPSKHAMLVTGYDTEHGYFRIRNSFGPNWCDRGYAWIPMGVLLDTTAEAYIVSDMVDEGPQQPRLRATMHSINGFALPATVAAVTNPTVIYGFSTGKLVLMFRIDTQRLGTVIARYRLAVLDRSTGNSLMDANGALVSPIEMKDDVFIEPSRLPSFSLVIKPTELTQLTSSTGLSAEAMTFQIEVWDDLQRIAASKPFSLPAKALTTVPQ